MARLERFAISFSIIGERFTLNQTGEYDLLLARIQDALQPREHSVVQFRVLCGAGWRDLKAFRATFQFGVNVTTFTTPNLIRSIANGRRNPSVQTPHIARIRFVRGITDSHLLNDVCFIQITETAQKSS
jgi:hypothetical protein